MALMDFIKKQFIDIIEWSDDSRDTLSYRFPDEDKEIKRGAQLIVRESQIAQFVYLGAFGDQFGMLDHVGRVADDARNEDLSGRKLCVLPHLPLVLVTRIGPLDHVSPDFHLEDQIHDVL